METVNISKKHYEEMLERIDFLDCLEACGIDNWEGYDEACEMFRSEEY